MQEILSIAAYIPFAVLPEGVTQDIISEVKRGFLKGFTFSDENTELYFLKAQGSCCDYEVTVSTVWSEDEPPETEIIYLALCEDERKEVDRLIIERIQTALQRIDEI
jgi:hypothetical protein